MQLEEELSLRRAEIDNLQALLRGPDSEGQANEADADPRLETLLLRQQLSSAGREHHKESRELKEKYETAQAESQQEIDSLKSVVDKQNQEISELKHKVQQATKENMEMMDTWKVLHWLHSSLFIQVTIHVILYLHMAASDVKPGQERLNFTRVLLQPFQWAAPRICWHMLQ